MRFFPPLQKARGGERPSREGGTCVDRPLLDPLLQLSPEQSGQEEFKLQLLPGEITSAIPHLHKEHRMGLVLLFSNS